METTSYSAQEVILKMNGIPGVHVVVDSQATEVTLAHSAEEQVTVVCLDGRLTLQTSGERLDIYGRREESTEVYDNASRMKFNDGEVAPTASATPKIVTTWVYPNGTREIRTVTPEGDGVETLLVRHPQKKRKLILTVPPNIPVSLIGRHGAKRLLIS